MDSVLQVVTAPHPGSLEPLLRARWLRAIEGWVAGLTSPEALGDGYLQYLSDGIDRLDEDGAELMLPSLCELEAAPSACRVGAALGGVGAPGRWSLPVAGTEETFFGPFRLHLEGAVEVESDGAGVAVTSGGEAAETWRFERRGGCWDRADDHLPTAFEIAGRTVPILGKGDLVLGAGAPQADLGRRAPREDVAAVFREAAALIETASPGYAAWIANVLRAAEVVETDGRTVQSGSYPAKPGSIVFTYPVAADHLATLMVHESAHQYLHQYHAAIPVADMDDTRRYYSPFRQTERPLYGILLALHAAVNILAFVEAAIPHRPDSGFLAQERLDLREAIGQMLGSMGSAPGLTESGERIVERLEGLVA